MLNQIAVRGAFLGLIAGFFLIQSFGLTIGNIGKPGPGLFPLIISGFLMLVALAVLVRSRLQAAQPLSFEFRNIALVSAALVAFVMLTERINMIAGIVALVLISAFAVEDRNWRRTAIIAVALCGVAYAMKKGLGVQLPLI